MKWFKPGLDKDQLKKAYRELAKKYHPDLSKDPEAATQIMQEINDEYNMYFTLAQKISIGVDYDAEMSKYKKGTSIKLVFFMRNKMGKEGSWFGYTNITAFTSFWLWSYKTNVSIKVMSDDSDGWSTFKGGFALCEFDEKYATINHVVSAKFVNADISAPTEMDMYFAILASNDIYRQEGLVTTNAKSDVPFSFYDGYIRIKAAKYGEMWLAAEHNIVYAKVNGRIMHCPISPKVVAKWKYNVIARYKDFEDLSYWIFQECSKEEFYDQHDIDWAPRYCPATNKVKWYEWIYDPTVYLMAKRGILDFYESTSNFKMRYGTFNGKKFMEHIHEFSIDDIEDTQDYLDQLNGAFEDHIKSLIKRGKLKIT